MPDPPADILARWGELLAAATPGEWAVMRDADGVITSRIGPVASVFVADRDLALIVDLRNGADAVIRHVAELEAQLVWWKQHNADLRVAHDDALTEIKAEHYAALAAAEAAHAEAEADAERGWKWAALWSPILYRVPDTEEYLDQLAAHRARLSAPGEEP